MMKTRIFIIAAFILLFGSVAFAQNGGKAEPNRIEFAKGKSSATKTGTLKRDEQYEFIFGATQGQTVTLSITSTPRGKFHSFKVLGAEGVEYNSEMDKNYKLTFNAPQTGDYFVTVNFQGTNQVRSGKFALTLKIVN